MDLPELRRIERAWKRAVDCEGTPRGGLMYAQLVNDYFPDLLQVAMGVYKARCKAHELKIARQMERVKA